MEWPQHSGGNCTTLQEENQSNFKGTYESTTVIFTSPRGSEQVYAQLDYLANAVQITLTYINSWIPPTTLQIRFHYPCSTMKLKTEKSGDMSQVSANGTAIPESTVPSTFLFTSGSPT